MARAEAAVARLDEAVARLAFVTDGGRCPDLDQWLFEARARYTDALDADLNVPQALGHVFGVVRKVNGQINRRGIDREQAGHVLEFLRGVDRTLAVIDFAPMARDDEVERLVAERSRARAAGEWAKADGARSRLHALGVEVIDTPSGTRWRRR
jgi:cysteinyl-tRNA synthetase